jgi:putative FmdB family regulatory protein
MPIYDFECTQCGHKGELMRKISESSTTTCPSCQQESFTKMLSAPNFQLNGTGWYATDFKNNSAKNKGGADAPKSETTAEAAPAACGAGCACH